ncbi:hypothetical protein AB0O59_28850 [Streptomyces sp. NPDC088922]|uniref:hypothetical protein n=1 Tax=Streptomyces sp. NPDC088922 TaxID=3156671 RepID=UPI00344F82C9
MDRITLGLLAVFGLVGLVFWLGGRLADEVSELATAWLRALTDMRRAFHEFRREGWRDSPATDESRRLSCETCDTSVTSQARDTGHVGPADSDDDALSL